jgi:hypothetical protein
MRKRRGVDLAPVLGSRGAQPGHHDDQADNKAPGHALVPSGYGPTNLMPGLAGIKASCVHFPAFMAERA